MELFQSCLSFDSHFLAKFDFLTGVRRESSVTNRWYSPTPLAAASLHFCLAILWRIEAFSLNCPENIGHFMFNEKRWLQKNVQVFFFRCNTNDLYFHHSGGPGCGSWAGRCCSSSVCCAERHSCLLFVTWVWPKDQTNNPFYIPWNIVKDSGEVEKILVLVLVDSIAT